jgi:hypothetical protein
MNTAPKEPDMISRLTVSAVVFAVLGTASLGFAAQSQPQHAIRKSAVQSPSMQIVVLPPVEVIGHRSR